MVLKYYFDFMSQPSRACYILFKYIGFPFESHLVDLKKGQHFSDEFSKINYFKKVPAIEDNGFKLSESIAIMKYVLSIHDAKSSLFPKDPQLNAKIEEFLHWYHLNLRFSCGMYFRKMVLFPILTGKPPDVAGAQKYFDAMKDSIKSMNNYFLVQPDKFIGGSPTITIADILAACELSQCDYLCFSLNEFLKTSDNNNPNVLQWYESVKSTTQPYFDESHRILPLVKEKFSQRQAKL